MFIHHNPTTVSAPASAYSHGACAPANSCWLHISGQISLKADVSLAGDGEAQMQACWERIFAILTDGDMSKKDIVKVTAYVTDEAPAASYREIRDRNMERTLSASTLLVVSALAHPDWVVEIEAIAAG